VELALKPLPATFFARDALPLARALIGTYIVHGDRVGRIVETEAYRGPKDLACHARAGLTKRTRALLGPPAHAYVFLVYGVHECFNVVGGAEGRGHAVLIRAVEPVAGIPDRTRTSGPGLLTRALGISRAHDGLSLVGSAIFVAARTKRPRITVSTRIGVEYAGKWAKKPWRFYDPESTCVSKR
jgi:DNA-3-methyladenine glycosylase